jgi:hypothetical protein
MSANIRVGQYTVSAKMVSTKTHFTQVSSMSCFQVEPVHFGAQREEQVHVPAAADARKALPGHQGHRDHEDALKVRIEQGISTCVSLTKLLVFLHYFCCFL